MLILLFLLLLHFSHFFLVAIHSYLCPFILPSLNIPLHLVCTIWFCINTHTRAQGLWMLDSNLSFPFFQESTKLRLNYLTKNDNRPKVSLSGDKLKNGKIWIFIIMIDHQAIIEGYDNKNFPILIPNNKNLPNQKRYWLLNTFAVQLLIFSFLLSEIFQCATHAIFPSHFAFIGFYSNPTDLGPNFCRPLLVKTF